MSEIKKKGPIFDPGLCRCCGTMKKCRVLNVEYECFGQKEVYSDMFMDCFGLLLSHLEGKPSECLICATCVLRLREAFTFKRQVLRCEEAFLQMRMIDIDNLGTTPLLEQHSQIIVEEVKIEPMDPVKDGPDDSDEECPGDDQGGNEDMPVSDQHNQQESLIKPDHSDSNDDVPLQRLARQAPRQTPHRMQTWWMKQHRPGVSNTSSSNSNSNKPQTKVKKVSQIEKVQQIIRERDHSYMTDINILTIIEYSFACPFKCRHNNLLCFYCGAYFTDPFKLREHTSTEHNPKKFKVIDHKNMIKLDLSRIDCRLCDARIDDLEVFKRHISEEHDKKYYFDCRDFVLPFKLDKDNIKCAICHICFPYFHALNKHMNEHYSNYICETCGLGFVDNNRFMMHQSRHEQGSYPCDTCGKLFKSVYNRDLHIDRVHKKRGRVYCPKCDARLMSHPQKMKHLAEVHGEPPDPLPCTECDKVFETRRMLTIHWRKAHLKDFRYECQVCGQKFFTRFALDNHMPTHTLERNFKCKVCEKSYPRLKTLKEHMRIHTNDRRYRCHICGQAFIQNCSLKGHMKSQHPEFV